MRVFSLTFLVFILSCFSSMGQAKLDERNADLAKELPKPTDIKVLDEYYDQDGSFVRKIQYNQGHMRVTELIIKPKPKDRAVVPMKMVRLDTINKDSVYLVVNKSAYKVDVYYKKFKIRTYAAVFGPRPMENKCVEGDRCTPEGWFKIKAKNSASKYNKFMLLDYPNDSSVVRFNKLKQQKSIPGEARMGGNVGIHGTWKGAEDLIELGVGWTDGCVAIKNKDVDELFSIVNVGTRVRIVR